MKDEKIIEGSWIINDKDDHIWEYRDGKWQDTGVTFTEYYLVGEKLWKGINRG